MCLLNTGRELLTGNKQGLCCKTLDCWMLQAAGARWEEAFYQKIGAFLLGEELNTANRQWTQAEKEYEGNLEFLCFGVKLWDDGKVTYHANYKDCENDDGIMADSADELLEKLMSEQQIP